MDLCQALRLQILIRIAIVMPVAKALSDDIFIRPGREISVSNPDLHSDNGCNLVKVIPSYTATLHSYWTNPIK